MGTRADFYVGRGKDAEWIGSIAWDGYPDGIPKEVLTAGDESSYRGAVSTMIAGRDDGTTADMGWPWPWSDSGLTDYAYAFEGGVVYATCNRSWWPVNDGEPDDEEEGRRVEFPDMSDRKAVTWGKRSGLIVARV